MNKVILMGRLTKDPETKSTQSQLIVSTFTLAVNRRMSKNNEADFINCVAWNKTAEFCKNYLQKGIQVAVVGRIQTRSWDDTEGKKRYATEVVADEVYFADSKRDGSAPKAFSPKNGDSLTDAVTPKSQKSDEGYYPDEDVEDLPF